MTNNVCSVCVKLAERGITLDPERTKTFQAELLDVSEASIRRHFKHLERDSEPHVTAPPSKDPKTAEYSETWRGNEGEITVVLTEEISNEAILRKFGHDPEKVAIVGVLEETHWMMAGEWQHRYRFKTIRREALEPEEDRHDVSELLDLISSWEYIPTPEATAPVTLVVCPSDQQLGKVDWNGGTPDTIDRILGSYARAAEFAKSLHPSEIIIGELGDSIENIYSVSSQRGTNDLSLTEQIRTARRLAIEGVKMLAPHTERLRYCSVPSNHGTVRIGPKSPENHVLDDYGIEIAEQLRDVFENSNLKDKCTVEIPEFNYESLCIETNGTKLGMAHGHQARGADRLGDWWKGQSHGRMPMGDADIALFGHWHSFRVQQSGNARWLFVSPAQDNGSSWFSNSTGERSVTGMLSFTTSNGSWNNLTVF